MWRFLWNINNQRRALLFVLPLFPLFLKGQDFLWQEDPLPGEKTHTLLQTRSGLMFVGTDHGLFSFDGTEWLSIPRSDSIQATPTSLSEIKDTLWVGYEDGVLCYLSSGRAYPPAWEEGFPKVAITGIEQDSAGVLWFSTYGEGIYYVLKGRLYNIDSEDGLLDNDVYCMEQSKSGDIWVGTDRGINRCWLEDGKKSLKGITIEEGLPDYIVKSLASTEEGMLIGMDEKGICFFHLEDSSISVPENMETWEGGSINAVHNGLQHISIGTEEGELWELSGQELRKLHTFSSQINALTIDREGNLWCGLESSSLFRASISLIRWGEVPHQIQAVFAGKSQAIWLGTSSGLWRFDPKLSSLEKISIPALNILSLFEDSNETLWIGTFGEGLWNYTPQSGQLLTLSEEEGLANDNVLSIWGKGEDIWLATLGGVSHVSLPQGTQTPVFQNFDREEGLGTEYTYHVMGDSQGKIWIATDGKGLWYEEENKFIQIPQVSQQTIYGLTEDLENRLWFHTNGEGLWAIAGDSLITYTLSSGLESLQIYGIQALTDGTIFLLNDRGISLVHPQTQVVSSSNFASLIPDWEPTLNSLHRASDGSIWMSSQGMLFQYTPFPLSKPLQPQPILKEVGVFLEPVEKEKLLQLSHTENYLSFTFAGIWFQAPDALTYRYRLNGLDLDWQETQGRRATYPKLSPGSYTFELQASITGSFQHSDLLRIPIHIRKPFWQTGWFIFLVAGSLLGLVRKTIQIRENRLRKEENFKRNQVKFQLETLQSQINPHFLFNSFNTLVSLIEDDQENAVDYVEQLSDFFRNILELKDKSFISLHQEIALLHNYYEIQQNRYRNNFILDMEIPSSFHPYIIPPLCLQLLVENALKHNSASEQHPLKVEIFVEEHILHVRNNLQPKRGALPSTHLGLENIIKRFELLGSQAVQIHKGPRYFYVKLPLIEPHEYTHH